MFKKKKHKALPYAEMTLRDLLKTFIISKLPKQKEKIANGPVVPPPPIPEDVNYIAIVLDGVVEDVMRAQNRLAALLLSNPDFVEFDPKVDSPKIGQTKFIDGKFVYSQEQLMTDAEISETLKKMVGKNNEDKK